MPLITPFRIRMHGGGAAAVVPLANTLSLNHWDGTNGATTSPDDVSGPVAHFYSGESLKTAVKKFGSASLGMNTGGDSSIDGFSIPANTQNWTVECFFQINAGDAVFMHLNNGSTNYVEFVMTTTLLQAAVTTNGGAFNLTSAAKPSNGTWYHLALVREGTAFSLYFNGNRVATHSDANDMPDAINKFTFWNATDYGLCYIDETRISGIARYSGATYSVPIAAFTVD